MANLAVAALGRGEIECAFVLGEESFSIYSELGDRSRMALALINLGDAARGANKNGPTPRAKKRWPYTGN